jgi:hypothetical protein
VSEPPAADANIAPERLGGQTPNGTQCFGAQPEANAAQSECSNLIETADVIDVTPAVTVLECGTPAAKVAWEAVRVAKEGMASASELASVAKESQTNADGLSTKIAEIELKVKSIEGEIDAADTNGDAAIVLDPLRQALKVRFILSHVILLVHFPLACVYARAFVMLSRDCSYFNGSVHILSMIPFL